MEQQYPYLKVIDLDGVEKTIWFEEILEQKQNQEKQRLSLGRRENNDIVLSDPYKKISRFHCAIEWEGGRWWLIDEDSANGTFLRRNNQGTEIDVRSEGKISLKHGDVILILGKLLVEDKPLFWQFTFCDPEDTEELPQFQQSANIEYNLTEEKLFRIQRKQREEITLTPQEKRLIHYMSQTNRANSYRSVICKHEELIEAIWGDPFGHTHNEIIRLVWGIRNKIETDSGEPRFLQNVRGQGYRLEIQIIP